MESALSCSHWSEGGFTPNPYMSYPAALQWLNKGKEVLHQLPLSHFPSWSKYSNWLKKSSFSNLKAIIIRPVMPLHGSKVPSTAVSPVTLSSKPWWEWKAFYQKTLRTTTLFQIIWRKKKKKDCDYEKKKRKSWVTCVFVCLWDNSNVTDGFFRFTNFSCLSALRVRNNVLPQTAI